VVHIPGDIRHSSEEDNFLVAAADTVLDLKYLDHEKYCHMGSWNTLPAVEVVGHLQKNSFADSLPVL
jgi:hypothetical protein